MNMEQNIFAVKSVFYLLAKLQQIELTWRKDETGSTKESIPQSVTPPPIKLVTPPPTQLVTPPPTQLVTPPST
ncbi:hypothetical protein EB796_010779 [Bugula neritina]|uniref:Uncharacterized protein n=1 Tax=Bugula neritina TaxID=10212 RepID=A0A7J7JY71_BUGNE|nr:hypothetical protein EB796_010779 [Bugula neritina]